MKYILSLFIVFLYSLHIQAQPFFSIPPKDYPITEHKLPIFSHRFSLGEGYTQNTYHVSIIYPEYAPLSHSEIHTLKKIGFKGTTIPTIEQDLTINRQQGFLNIHFIPIVLQKGKWYRLINCKIKIETSPLRQIKQTILNTPQQRYTTQSVLAKGKWYKISVPKEGIYSLKIDQLKKMGFNDINRVKIYGYGGRLLPEILDFNSINRLTDDLEEVATYQTKNELLFFAEGTIRWNWKSQDNQWERIHNTFSTKSYYFITEGDHPLHITERSFTPSPTAQHLSSVIDHALYEDDAFAWYEGGIEFFDSYDFINGNTHSFTLLMPDALPTQTAHLEVAFSAASPTKNTTANISFNTKKVGNINVSNYDGEIENAKESRKTFTISSIQDKNSITIESTPGNHARLNYILASYYRKLTAKPFVFSPATTTSREVILDIAHANANHQVWMIGRTGEPTTSIRTSLNNDVLEVPIQETQRRYIVVDVSAKYDTPQIEGKIENQNLHGDSSLDMIIIVPSSGRFDKEAERLAAAHRKNNLRVKIVSAQQIYNEFSSGTPDATAYRRYLKMLYDRATNKQDLPKYLTLFGGCNWDNRFIITQHTKDINPDNLLLAYEMSPRFQNQNISIGTLESFVTDDYYGYLDDGEGKNISREQLDLNIGRILCTDEHEAKILVDKALEYMSNKEVGSWKNKIVVMADYGDNNLHMRDCEATVHNIETTDPRLNIQKIYWDAYPYTTSATGNSFPQVTKIIQNEMNKGAIMFNYIGHGSPNLISHASLLKTQDFEKPNNGNLPLWVFASCEITPYDQQIFDIGRAAIYNPKGGAVSVLCASRSVYAVYNRAINSAFSKYVLSSDAQNRPYSMGEALRKAKNELIYNGSDRTINKLKYVLLGDPAIVLSIPRDTIIIDSINHQAIGNTDVQLSAGEKVQFSGYVVRNKAIRTDFNGKVTATLYDRIEKITCLNNGNKATSQMTFNTRQKQLFSGNDSVRNGRFTINVIIPRNISYSTAQGALFLYAVDQHQNESSGINTNFYFNGSVTTEKNDTLGPKAFIYLNDSDFVDGGFVGTDALFGASVVDSSGINAFGAGTGHNIELMLDNNPQQSFILNDYFNYDFGSTIAGHIQFMLKNLTPGKHQLKFRIWDINDNSTTRYLNFVVNPKWNKDVISVSATLNPAKEYTNFIATLYNLEGTQQLKIEVIDLMGRIVWSKDVSIAQGTNYYNIPWNLSNNAGTPLDKGIYIYRATIKDKNKTIKTKSKKIIITP